MRAALTRYRASVSLFSRQFFTELVSIVHFRLKNNQSVVNFAETNDIFDAYIADSSAFGTVVKKKRTLNAIGFNLSRPLRLFDNPLLEYTPTQAVFEFCKLHGAGGIRFRSSLHPGGVNVVLFNSEEAVCADVETVGGKRVQLESQLMGQM